jgi:hypothetical protein
MELIVKIGVATIIYMYIGKFEMIVSVGVLSVQSGICIKLL